MKRQILATLLSLCLLVGMLPTVALATGEGTKGTPWDISAEGDGNNVTAYLEQNNPGSDSATYTLTVSGTGAMVDFTNGKQPWSKSLSSITEIEISDGITEIGAHAFRGTKITSLHIPDSVERIGNYALIQNTKLLSITVGADNENSNFKVVNDVLFTSYGTTGWELTCFPIAKYTDKYTVPEFTTSIGANTMQMAMFKEVSILAPCSINSYAFAGNTNLTKVVLADGVTFGTEGINIGSGYDGIFSGCTNLASVENFENANIDMIGASVFKDTSVKELLIPASVKEIKGNAFACTNTSVSVKFAVGSQLQTIESSAFTNEKYTAHFDQADIDAYVAFVSAGFSAQLGDKTLPQSDIFIYEWNGSETVAIFGLTEGGKTAENITIPADAEGYPVTEIADNVFNGDTAVKTITFDSGDPVKIGEKAFWGCSALETFNAGMRQISLATNALGHNPNLKTVIIPNVSSLGEEIFTMTVHVKSFIINGNATCEENSLLNTNDNAFMSSGNVFIIGETESQTEAIKDVFKNQEQIVVREIIVGVGSMFPPETDFTNNVLAKPEKENSIFGGWYDNANYTGNPVTTVGEATTYYAKWIGMDDIELQYGGEQKITVSGVTLSGYQSDDLSVATVDTDGKVTAVGVGTAIISATGTYNGQHTTFKATVTVTPRVLTYTLAGGDTGSGSISYNYSGGHQKLSDYITFQWKDDPYTKVTLVEGTDINYTYSVTDSEGQGGGTAQTYDYLPMPVGNYDNVKFNLLNENYTFGLSGGGTRDYLEIDVNVAAGEAQRAYLASAWPKADQNFVYTGQGVLPVEGTLNAYADNSTSSDPVDIGTFTVNIEGLNDTSFHSEVSGISAGTDLSSISGLTLPTEPGTYIITASAANDSYYLYKSLVFTISKATVTVKADDKSVYVGDAMPELTYTVSGLASGDSLSGTVSLYCEATDTNTAGTYTITPSGGAVPNTEHYNSEIVYQSGTLTVSTRSSGGGGGSSSGGSSSSNVSGSGDDVSISASGGSVTSSQMESAVNKADEGSTITIKATSSTTVSLPVGGMADAADNDNDVLLDLRYGEVTLSARTIAGLTDGVSSSGKIKVSITSQTSSKDETISDLLDKGAAVFDVSVTVNDVEVHSFDSTLTITLTVSNLSKITDPHILHILTDGTKEYYAPDSISGNTITVKGVRNLSTFAVIPGSEVPEEQTNPFTDVYESDYYYDAVLWAVANGVTNGTSATTFGPNVTVTRAQMVTFLWRAYGSPEATGANPFTDVSTSDYYYDAVLWAVANGVTNGTSATTFSPDMAVTRAQAVTFQWRAAGSPVVSGSSFGDVSADAYYADAVTWAVANGITNGTGGNTFSPDLVVSRAQAVTFLYREQE